MLAQPSRTQAVLFDLDGTLADTAPDLAYALNSVLHERGHARLPFSAIRSVVSLGGKAMIQLGFSYGPSHADYETVQSRFLEIYSENIFRETALFPGMAALITTLEQREIPWGVVTNKPTWLTEPLMYALGLHTRAACIVSGDTTAHAKPHPEPLLHASRLAGVAAEHCLYIGDAERDIEAGRRAGMRTLIALFGYLSGEDQPENWGADGMIHSPAEALPWIQA